MIQFRINYTALSIVILLINIKFIISYHSKSNLGIARFLSKNRSGPALILDLFGGGQGRWFSYAACSEHWLPQGCDKGWRGAAELGRGWILAPGRNKTTTVLLSHQVGILVLVAAPSEKEKWPNSRMRRWSPSCPTLPPPPTSATSQSREHTGGLMTEGSAAVTWIILSAFRSVLWGLQSPHTYLESWNDLEF